MSTGAPYERETSLVTDLSQLLGVHGSATYRQFLRVPALSLGLFAVRPCHADTQEPHQRDEVYVVEHSQAVMAHADWIIELGPGAGHDGGRIVFEGTPADLVAARSTLTGEHLAAYVGA